MTPEGAGTMTGEATTPLERLDHIKELLVQMREAIDEGLAIIGAEPSGGQDDVDAS